METKKAEKNEKGRKDRKKAEEVATLHNTQKIASNKPSKTSQNSPDHLVS